MKNVPAFHRRWVYRLAIGAVLLLAFRGNAEALPLVIPLVLALFNVPKDE